MLYLVATPIGNLKDITFRAVEVLKSVTTILAEDTRTSGVLMREYEIHTPMISFHMFNEREREEQVIEKLKGGTEMALISDAGTPGICDPGAALVRRCHQENISVQGIPGPCAIPLAFSLYGSDDNFQFVGFLKKKKELIDILYYPGLSIAYETPHHLMKTLEWMEEIAPDKPLFIARELTKIYEETLEGTAKTLIAHFQKKKILGEYVLIFPGKENPFEKSPQELVDALQLKFGISSKEALVVAAKLLNRPKRNLYDDLHRSRPESGSDTSD